MNLRYCPTPEATPGSGQPHAAVVIDVLRATTTMGWALHNGAAAVHVFADLDALRRSAAAVPQEERLLAGERGGRPLEGFDLGNCPVAVTPAVVAGRQLFLSTTNGTRALERVQAVPHVFTCSLNNLAAVGARLQALAADRVWIVGSGWEGSYSLEDSLAAGALLHTMATALASDPQTLCENDEMTAAAALWQVWRHNPEVCLRLATHGQRLQRLGNHDADFHCCAAVNSLTVVPTQVRPGVFGLV